MTDHPDFSGVWWADFGKSTLEIEAPASTLFEIHHDDPVLLITRTHKAEGFEDTISLTLSTDGTESLHHRNKVELRIHCSWQGSSLLCRSKILVGDSEAENTVIYTLSPDGQQILADERYVGPPKDYHNQWVLVRDRRTSGKVRRGRTAG
jgi:hypothetical protein